MPNGMSNVDALDQLTDACNTLAPKLIELAVQIDTSTMPNRSDVADYVRNLATQINWVGFRATSAAMNALLTSTTGAVATLKDLTKKMNDRAASIDSSQAMLTKLFQGAAALMQMVGLAGIGNIPGAMAAAVSAAAAFAS